MAFPFSSHRPLRRLPSSPHRHGRPRQFAANSSLLAVAAATSFAVAALTPTAAHSQAENNSSLCVTIRGTALTNLNDVLQEVEPKCLRISDNDQLPEIELSSTDFPGLAHLERLDIDNNNNVQTITLSNLANLKSLDIDYNKNLETIGLDGLNPDEQNPQKTNFLEYLDINNNANLKNLNLPEFPCLIRLSIDNNNQLEKINLSRIPELAHLRIDNNNDLKKINLHKPDKSDKLKYLDIHNNKRLEKVCWKEKDDDCKESTDAAGTEIQDGGTAD